MSIEITDLRKLSILRILTAQAKSLAKTKEAKDATTKCIKIDKEAL